MGLETYQVARDHFEPDENTHLAFPCCSCRHRHGTDKEEPCIRCDWNLGAKPDDELTPNAPGKPTAANEPNEGENA